MQTYATQTFRMFPLALVLTALIPIHPGQAQEIGRSVVVSDSASNDVYAAGRSVEVPATVSGDVLAAGGTIVINGSVSEDVMAAGRSVTLSGDVADDVRLAGRRVTLSGNVEGHAALAGREARIESGSTIGEWAWVTGSRLTIAGKIGGDLKAFGRSVELSGQVEGNAELSGRRIHIGDGTVINGDLIWRSRREPVISENAVITGEIRKGEPLREHRHRSGRRGIFFRLIMTVCVIVAAGVLYTLFRAPCATCAAALQARPWASLMTGLAVFATTPLVIMLLFFTGVGALLAVLLMPAYVLALMLGGLAGVSMIARIGLMRARGNPNPGLGLIWLAIAVVAIVISSLYVIRPIGMLVASLVMFLGLGALSLETYRRYRD